MGHEPLPVFQVLLPSTSETPFSPSPFFRQPPRTYSVKRTPLRIYLLPPPSQSPKHKLFPHGGLQHRDTDVESKAFQNVAALQDPLSDRPNPAWDLSGWSECVHIFHAFPTLPDPSYDSRLERMVGKGPKQTSVRGV